MRQPQKSNNAGSSNAGALAVRVCRTHGKNSVHSSNLHGKKGAATIQYIHLFWKKGCDKRMRQPDTWNGSLIQQTRGFGLILSQRLVFSGYSVKKCQETISFEWHIRNKRFNKLASLTVINLADIKINQSICCW